MTQPYKDRLRQAETALDAANAEIERLKANLQKAHEGWQAEVKIIRDIADDNLTCAETAEAKITQLHVEISRARDVGRLYQSLFKDFCERGKIITTLESDLSAERELSDRLASDAKNLIRWFIANLGESKGELDDIQNTVSAHTTRRNK